MCLGRGWGLAELVGTVFNWSWGFGSGSDWLRWVSASKKGGFVFTRSSPFGSRETLGVFKEVR